jgi:hypothetical protein
LLEPLERGGGLDAELRHELLSCTAIDGERLRLPTLAIEREHQLPAQPLAKRMRRDEIFELGDDSGVRAELELRLDPQLERVCAQFLQPRDRGLRKRFIEEVGQGRPAPDRERLVQRRHRRSGIAGGEGVASSGEQLLEAMEVELIRLQSDQVRVAACEEDAAPKCPAEPRHANLERLPRGGRWRLAPQLVDQAVDGNGLAGMEKEEDEQSSFLRAPDVEWPTFVPHLERSQ